MSGSLIKQSRAAMLLAAAAMVLSIASAGGAQAAAPQKCTIKGYQPGQFVVAATETEKRFSVKTSGCTQKNWAIDLMIDNAKVSLATKAKPMTTFIPNKMNNGLAGNYQVIVTVKSTDNKVTKKTLSFSWVRRSTFGTSLKVGPRAARSDAKIKIVGVLQRVSWGETPSYGPYAKRSVRLQFKATGKKKFVNVKTVKTNAAGKVSTTATATKSGVWRLSFAGDSKTGAANSAVAKVTVR